MNDNTYTQNSENYISQNLTAKFALSTNKKYPELWDNNHVLKWENNWEKS